MTDAEIPVSEEVQDLFYRSKDQSEEWTGQAMDEDEFLLHLLIWSAKAYDEVPFEELVEDVRK